MNNFKQPKRKYLIDYKIIDGLNLTIDQNKIRKNCKLLDIDMSNSPSKISKRNNISILTVGYGNNRHLQYEVKHNFNIDKLNSISPDSIPHQIKPLILQAHQLTQNDVFKDLITS